MKQKTLQGRWAEQFARRALIVTICLLLSLPLMTQAAESGETMSEPGHFRYEGVSLCPGGCAFGVKFSTKGVLVVGLSAVRCED